jgi:hypothetical protein
MTDPRPTSEDICEPRSNFVVTVEIFGDEYEVEAFWLNKERWDAMSSREQANFLAANEEQVLSHLNIYTQEITS